MGLICERLLLHTPDCMRLLVAAPRVLGGRLPTAVLARGRTEISRSPWSQATIFGLVVA